METRRRASRVGFLNPTCVDASRVTGLRTRKVSVGRALIHLAQSAVTEPAQLVLDEEESKFVYVDTGKAGGGRIRTHCAVAGKPARKSGKVDVLLLHGVLGSTYSFKRILEPLSRIGGGQCVAFDRPPFGLSSRPRPFSWALAGGRVNPYSLDFGKRHAQGVMEEFQMDKVVAVGHSMGASLAIQMAVNNPGRVRALVLIAPATRLTRSRIRLPNFLLFLFKIPIIASVLFFMAVGKKATCRASFEKVLERYYFDSSRLDCDDVFYGYTRPMRHSGWVRGALEIVRAMRDYDSSDDARRLGIPVLILSASHDKIVQLPEVEHLQKCIPHAEFQTISDCGHNPHEEKPDVLLGMVDDWLKRNEAAL
ncbi:hypothetical protein NDN08_005030 [Rhodosorus marinus]|uniref:AB hydrolase-1 domain-containing protein n=1 Tax=Rhodosorus marinus TaxID=101924 RepID=A0AAV8V3Y1_9RHOD|nr:hypothetical protein NDN08_005030 [Rhodosorus marinus]